MELMWLKEQRAFTALYASKGDSWQGRDAYLAGTKRDPQIMTAAMQADRSSRRASIVLVAPVTCLSSPEPEDPDLLRCWRVNRGADSDLMGLLIVGSCQKGPCNFLAHSRVRVTAWMPSCKEHLQAADDCHGCLYSALEPLQRLLRSHNDDCKARMRVYGCSINVCSE